MRFAAGKTARVTQTHVAPKYLRSRATLERPLAVAALGFLSLLAVAGCSPPSSEHHAAAARAHAIAAPEPDDFASPKRLRLISSEQYLNTLASIFGPDVRPGIRFAPFSRVDGLLAVGAASAGVTDGQLEQYKHAASVVAALVTSPERRHFLIACKPVDPKAADNACAAQFLTKTGRLLFRRPLGADKIRPAVDLAGAGAARLHDFYAGLSIALEAMLLNPQVLYVQETSEPDPEHLGRERLDAYSLASRLSFFLWNAAPDDTLLKAAERGELTSENGRARAVDMMLASPRLEAGMRAFFDDMFGFDDFANLSKDPKIYPSFTGEAVQDAREQTLRTAIDHLITKNKDYRDLFTTRDTFISPALATVYRLPAATVWQPYTFPADSARVGLLTQISFLTAHSHPGRSSPTLRGKALREILLCQKVPPPPPNVNFSIVENPDSDYRTARERLTAHRSNPVCAGCHKITDPMGLALENFDGAGQYRDDEKGTPIDPSGALDGKEFKDVVGLGQALHDHPAAPQCLVNRLYAYGTGGRVLSRDKPILNYFTARFAADGYRLRDLLRAIALSKAFSEVADPSAAPVKTASAPTGAPILK